jgi:hypothetical protein
MREQDFEEASADGGVNTRGQAKDRLCVAPGW